MFNEFGTQVEQLIPRLRRYARALTGERAAADDLVQDTLERAWNKFHLWRRGSDLRAWLFTIMHNVYVNQVRSRKGSPIVAVGDDDIDAPVRASQADMLEIRDLETALQRLPAEQREVLLLVALERLSYDEAARALGIPIGTVMSRLSRARERLRLLLANAPAGSVLKVIK
jgi:RNA polymerase sigma-70 factor, ECF subfamily